MTILAKQIQLNLMKFPDSFYPGISNLFLTSKGIQARVFPIAFLLFLAACSNKNTQNSPGEIQAPETYKVLTLEPRSVTLFTEYPASIQGSQNIEIRPKVDGFVEKIFVDEGSLVKRGQLLFKINAPQYEQDVRTAEAGIKIAEADVNTAKLQVEKVKPLVEKDIISHYELESAQNTLQTKEAVLAQAKAALENARINLSYTTINSPVDGVIGSLPYKLGSLVSSTDTAPLTTVYNTATVFVYFAMNEKQLLEFSKYSKSGSLESKIDSMPKVTLLLSDGTVYEHQGRLETVNGLINSSTGSADFRADFINPKGLLRSGGSATVRIPAVLKNAIIIPQTATYQLQDKRFVYLIDHKNLVRNVVVTTMDNTPGQFYIVTNGLKAGDKIIVESADNLTDGTEIKPEEVIADSVYKNLN